MARRPGLLPAEGNGSGNGRSSPPERVLLAQNLISQMSYGAAVKEMMARLRVSRSSCTRAIQLARILMAKLEEDQRPQAKATYVARLERIADKAEDAGEFGDAVRAYRELITLRGLREPEVVLHGRSSREAYKDLTDAQIDALAALEDAKEKARNEADVALSSSMDRARAEEPN